MPKKTPTPDFGYTPEQIKEMQDFFKNNDFTANYSLQHEVTLTGAKAEVFGKAEFSTFEDGSIETISFFTTGFSSFFTAKKQLDIAVAEQIFAGAAAVTDINTGNINNEGNSLNIYFLIAIIAAALIVITVLIVVFIKKRKSKQSK